MQTKLWALVLLLPFVAPRLSICAPQAKGEPGWLAAKAAIEAWYKKELPESKIEEIVRAEEREILDYGLTVRYYGHVRVERENKRRSRDHMAVTFARVAGKWEVDRVAIMGSDPLADLSPPGDAEALRMFREVWKKDKCEGYDIHEVKAVGEPRFQRESVFGDQSKAKRWFIYDLEIHATGNGDFKITEEGAAYLLEIKNGLLWNPVDKTWSVDPRWVKCSGFEKLKKD